MEQRYMIALWTAKGWCPLTYPSKKMFAQHWRVANGTYSHDTLRAFQSVKMEESPFPSVVWEVSDENFLREIEAWAMMSLEGQNLLADII